MLFSAQDTITLWCVLFRWEQVWSRSAVSCRLTPERSCSWTSTTSMACRTCTMKSWWPCWKRCSETSCVRSSLHRRYLTTRMHLMLSAERILKQLGDLTVGPNHLFQMLVSPVTSQMTQTHFWTFKIALWYLLFSLGIAENWFLCFSNLTSRMMVIISGLIVSCPFLFLRLGRWILPYLNLCLCALSLYFLLSLHFLPPVLCVSLPQASLRWPCNRPVKRNSN